jgi:hypothetical protein
MYYVGHSQVLTYHVCLQATLPPKLVFSSQILQSDSLLTFVAISGGNILT